MAKSNFKCPKCGRTFSMKAHLARHLSAGHGRGTSAGKAPRARSARGPKGRPVGRPKGIVSRFGLRDMTLEDLGGLMSTARAELHRRLSEIEKMVK